MITNLKHLLLILIVFLSLDVSAQNDIIKVGQQIPSFEISLPNGETINSTSLKGKVVFINFFATWCGPCLEELPVLEDKVWKKYKSNEKFQLFVIGRNHTDAVVEAFKTKHHFDLPMYPDKGKLIYSLFATKYIPRNYIIDKNGKVVYASIGYDLEEFKKMLKVLEKLL